MTRLRLLVSVVVLWLAGSASSLAQIHVEGVLLTEDLAPRYIVVQMVGVGRMTPLDVDYGSPHRPLVGFTRLTDANGEVILFRNLIAALNYLHRYGWHLPTMMDAIPPSMQEEGILLVRKTPTGE